MDDERGISREEEWRLVREVSPEGQKAVMAHMTRAYGEEQKRMAESASTQRVHFWRNRFDRGYVGAIEIPASMERDEALDRAFAAFNAGSGSEIDFKGPSAMVEDVFAIERQAGGEKTLEAYRIDSCGFQQVEFPPIKETLKAEEGRHQTALEKALHKGEASTDISARRQQDLDIHDRLMLRGAADASRDVLHDNGPGKEPGAYTIHEARDRAAHTPPAHTLEPEQ